MDLRVRPIPSVRGSTEPAEDRDRGGAVVGGGRAAASAMFESLGKPPAKIPAALDKRKRTVTGATVSAYFAFDAKPMMTSAPTIAMPAPKKSVAVGRWPSASHNHMRDAAM
jgi:hypothetical protein